MSESPLYIWTISDGVVSRTDYTDAFVEEYWWCDFYYFEMQLYWFADADGNVPDVPVASVPEETQADISTLCNWIYAKPWGSVGGPLHIVLDDLNIEDEHLEFCRTAIDDKGRVSQELTPLEKVSLHQLLTLLGSLSIGGRLLALEEAERAEGAY